MHHIDSWCRFKGIHHCFLPTLKSHILDSNVQVCSLHIWHHTSSCKVNCFKVSTKGFLNTKNHSSACICICICICYMLWLPTIDDTLVHSIYELVPGVEGLRLVWHLESLENTRWKRKSLQCCPLSMRTKKENVKNFRFSSEPSQSKSCSKEKIVFFFSLRKG